MLLFGDFFARNILPDYMHLHICANYFSKKKRAFHTFSFFLRGIFCQIICICTFAQSIVQSKNMRFIRFSFSHAEYFARLYAFAHLRKVLFKTKICVSYVFHFFTLNILPDYMHLHICAKYCSKQKHAFHTFSIFSRGVFCQIICICTFAKSIVRKKTCVS